MPEQLHQHSADRGALCLICQRLADGRDPEIVPHPRVWPNYIDNPDRGDDHDD